MMKKRMNSRPLAVALAERGWFVFPIPPNSKPAWENWPEHSCDDPYEVGSMWPEHEANIGVHCGPSELLVFDVDIVGDYETVIKKLPFALPDTFTVQTASGKWHFYFSVPLENSYTNRTKVDNTAIDIRVNNGYVLGPGSEIEGTAYKIIYDDEPAWLPDYPRLDKWVRAREVKKRTRHEIERTWSRDKYALQREMKRLATNILTAKDGELNNKLYGASCDAGELIWCGHWDEEDAIDFLVQHAREANLEEYRIMPTIRSGLHRGERNIDEQS
jgi:Bifunctional DNA primase/polymerase, N-terminal